MHDSEIPFLLFGALALAGILFFAARWQWRIAEGHYCGKDRFAVGGWYEIGGCAVLALSIYGVADWMATLSYLPPVLRLGQSGLDYLARTELILFMAQTLHVFDVVSDNEFIMDQWRRNELAQIAFNERNKPGLHRPPPVSPPRCLR